MTKVPHLQWKITQKNHVEIESGNNIIAVLDRFVVYVNKKVCRGAEKIELQVLAGKFNWSTIQLSSFVSRLGKARVGRW
jgi:hypothetical protein